MASSVDALVTAALDWHRAKVARDEAFRQSIQDRHTPETLGQLRDADFCKQKAFTNLLRAIAALAAESEGAR